MFLKNVHLHLLRKHNRKEDLPNIPHQANNYISGVAFPSLLDMHGLERDENIGVYFVRTTEVGIERRSWMVFLQLNLSERLSKVPYIWKHFKTPFPTWCCSDVFNLNYNSQVVGNWCLCDSRRASEMQITYLEAQDKFVLHYPCKLVITLKRLINRKGYTL